MEATSQQVSDLATVAEAAKALRVSRGTVYTLIDRGHLKSINILRSRRIPWSSIEEVKTKGASS